MQARNDRQDARDASGAPDPDGRQDARDASGAPDPDDRQDARDASGAPDPDGRQADRDATAQGADDGAARPGGGGPGPQVRDDLDSGGPDTGDDTPLPPDPDDGRPLEERAAGQMGPGITRRQGIDPTLLTAAIFVLLGFTPVAWWQTILGFGYFGPLEVPAILAMVGVLFAFIAVLRAVDTEDVPLRTQALIAAAVGLLRLFVVPFF